VEDEPLARQTLRRFVGGDARLVLVGEAADGDAAVALLDREHPELVFLDVQLPECSGLEVLERAGHRPAVVFTTAHAEYAVHAFEAEAVDYLVKPFGRRRFGEAVDRVLRRLAAPAPASPPPPDAGPLRLVFARRADVMLPVRLADVHHVEGADDHALLHTADGRHLVQMTLHELEQRLDGERFVRVHRQHIVNLDHVVALRPYDERRFVVHLRDGSRVVASRAGTQRLRAITR
jgi:two-component system LytT family response regulator